MTVKKRAEKTRKTRKTESHEDDNFITLYFKEISKVALLSREEEDAIARDAARGDKRAREKLIRANLRFVVNLAKKYQGQGLPLEDLISEGNIGLMYATERYDVDRGIHFISYAVWWIKQSILKAISEKSRMIRLPLNRANELVQIEKARRALMENPSPEGEIQDIAAFLGMDPDHVATMLNISRELISLESPAGDERDAPSLRDFIEDVRTRAPENDAINSALSDDIELTLETLNDKEAQIIRYRFGLGEEAPLSLTEIGDRFNLTKERIRQIEKRALQRLQQPSRKARLEGYVA